MPGGFPIAHGSLGNLSDQGTNTAASTGTALTASGSTNTKGSYSQLVASTPADACGFILHLGIPSSSQAGYLVDVAIGGAGSETIIVPNVVVSLAAGTVGTSAAGLSIFCPVPIPAGSRVAARVQSSTASATINAWVTLLDGNFDANQGLGNCNNYGALTASSQGTLIDAGAVANTKGSYVQMTASTTYDIGMLQLLFDNQKASETGAASFLVDIAVGGAGSETVIIPNIPFFLGTSSVVFNGAPPPLSVGIPAGSRIAARAQCTSTAAGVRKFGLTLLGYQL